MPIFTAFHQILRPDCEQRWHQTRPCKGTSNQRNANSYKHLRSSTLYGHGESTWEILYSTGKTAKPIHKLLSNKNDWYWGQPQQQAFQLIKQDISSAPLLALYNPQLTTTVSADASSYVLGAVLTQTQQTGEIRPVTYISRALTSAEQRYAQIEKEALAVTWACERLSNYLLPHRN